MRALVIAALCGSLMGCAQIDWTGEKQARAEDEAAMAQEDAACQSYGARPGSPEYVQCRMNFSNQRAATAENNRTIAMQYLLNRR